MFFNKVIQYTSKSYSVKTNKKILYLDSDKGLTEYISIS